MPVYNADGSVTERDELCDQCEHGVLYLGHGLGCDGFRDQLIGLL